MARFENTKADADFGMSTSATDIVIPTGAWTKMGSLQVGAQTAIQFGVGDALSSVDTRETATIRLDSVSGQLTDGKLRLRVSDANENSEKTVAEGLLAEWSAGKLLGKTGIKAGEDDFLKIEVYLNTGSTWDSADANNSVSIPTTTDTRR